MSVHKCPVCEGKGQVPAGFYYLNTSPSVINTSPETCRSCGGKGIIFEYGYSDFNDYNKPYEFGDYNSTSCIASQGCCAFCANNDGMVYTSNPVKYKCMIDRDWHEAGHCCENFIARSVTYLTNENGATTSLQIPTLNIDFINEGGDIVGNTNRTNIANSLD